MKMHAYETKIFTLIETRPDCWRILINCQLYFSYKRIIKTGTLCLLMTCVNMIPFCYNHFIITSVLAVFEFPGKSLHTSTSLLSTDFILRGAYCFSDFSPAMYSASSTRYKLLNLVSMAQKMFIYWFFYTLFLQGN